MKESKEKFNLPQFKVVVLGKEGNSVYICDGNQPVASLYWHGTKKTFGYADFIEAAPKMYALLDKCESCIRHLLYGTVDDPVASEAENTVSEIQKLLKEVRGEF